MGHAETLFVNQPVNDLFKCPICHDVLQEPETLARCEHVFCKECLTQWRQHQHTLCPMCRDQIDMENRPKPALKQFCQLIDGLVVKCPFGICAEQMELNQWLIHHRDHCKWNSNSQLSKCTKKCGANVVTNQLHDCLGYLKDQRRQYRLELERKIDYCRFLKGWILVITLVVLLLMLIGHCWWLVIGILALNLLFLWNSSETNYNFYHIDQ